MELDVTAEHASEILKEFSIGSCLSLKRLNEGLANRNYKLTTTQGHFLMKVCDEKSPEELAVQVRALEHLKKHDYPTPYIIPLSDGRKFYMNNSVRVIIYNFVKGKSGKPSPKITAEIGAAMGRLHLLPPISDLPRFNLDLTVIANFLAEIINTDVESHSFVRTLREACETLKEVNNPSLAEGMLHADLFADNAIFDDDENLVAVVDWEEVCEGKFILDVGMAAVGNCFPDGSHFDYELFSKLVKSYQSVRALTAIEVQLLPLYVKYSILLLAFWRFRQFNVRLKSEKQALKYKEMADRLLVIDLSKMASAI